MKPPKWPIRLLERFCPDELLEGIAGDLLEQFEADCRSTGARRARRRLVWNVFRLFHPYILLRNHLTVNMMNMDMLKSHLLVAGRHMKRQKFFSGINILGLSCAIAFVFLAVLFIRHELAYDQFHSRKASIFRVYHDIQNAETGQSKHKSAVTAVPLSRDLAAELPGIAGFTRYASSSVTIRKGATPYDEVVHFVDPAFLEIFDFPLLQGDPETALNEPADIILNTAMAEKYFGKSDPIGQELELLVNDTTVTLTVSGVVDARQEQSSLPFDFLMPIDQYKLLLPESMFESYNYGLLENYILLRPDTRQSAIEPKLTAAVEKYSTSSADEHVEYGLQPLPGLHLEAEVTGNALYTSPQKLYFMAALSLLVIFIACVNFITLSTSQALGRFREIGVRKTLGALVGQLRRQLVIESFFICLISGLIGLILAAILLHPFGRLIESELHFSIGAFEIAFLLGLLLVIATITGLLQAAIIVRKHTQDALSGKVRLAGGQKWFNDSLIVLQFSLSIILIIGAVTIRRQMQYIQHKDLGFDQERLLEINLGNTADKEAGRQLLARFKQRALQHPAVLEITASMNNSREPWTKLIFDQTDGSKEGLFYNQIDEDYLQTMGIAMAEGSNYQQDQRNATDAILVNESLVRHFGWQDPLNEQIPGSNFNGSHRIIGVVKDFHFSSLHQRIEPLILALDDGAISSGITGLSTYVWPPNLYQALVRVGTGDPAPVLQYLETSWKSVAPDKAFSYHFVDASLEAKYADERRWAQVMDWASVFAIGIAWLGLLGLMRLSLRKRVREIGIRKVMGASASGIAVLLSRRFLILLLISSAMAWPVAWLMLREWLASFSYRISLNPILFLLVGLGVLALTLGSVGWQSLVAARVNPVESLRAQD